MDNQEAKTPHITARSSSGTNTDERAPVGHLSIGSIIDGRYEITSLLGEGGMSAAYKARDNQLNQFVALKFLLSDRLDNPKDLMRFKREAKMASSLQHPYIAKVFGFGMLNDCQPYLVMEFIEGTTLAQRIQSEGQLPVEETLDIFIQLLDAVAYAHAHGILHRDIKPGNIIITNYTADAPPVKLLDFGIAKPLTKPDLSVHQITETGDIVGSPLYMSPEQARGAEIDERSDLYSIGCTLYEALTGGPPHVGQTPIATLLKREQDKPVPMSEASLGKSFSEQLEQVIARLLQTNPDHRYQTVVKLKDDLIAVKEGRLSLALPRVPAETAPEKCDTSFLQRRWGILAFLLLAPLAALLVLHSHSRKPEASPAMSMTEQSLQPISQQADRDVILVNLRSTLKMADSLMIALRYSEATKLYDEAHKTVLQEKITGPLLERVIRGLANGYRKQTKWKEARPFCEMVVDLEKNEHGESSEEYADAINQVAFAYIMEAKPSDPDAWKKAAPLLRQAESIYERTTGPTSIKTAGCLHTQGYVCSVGQPTHAEPLLEQVLVIYKKRKVKACLIGQALRDRAKLYLLQNKPAKAEICWREALAVLARERDTNELCQTLVDATAYYSNNYKSTDLRQIKRAQALCLHYLPFFENSSRIEAAIFLNSMGNLGMSAAAVTGNRPSDLQKQLVLFQKAIDILARNGDTASIAVASIYFRIGEIHRLQGDFKGDEVALTQGLNALKRGQLIGTTMWFGGQESLANSYLHQGNLEKAISLCKDQIAVCEASPKLKDSVDEARFFAVLATSYSHGKNYAGAEPLFKKARAIFARTEGIGPGALKIIDDELAIIAKATSK